MLEILISMYDFGTEMCDGFGNLDYNHDKTRW